MTQLSDEQVRVRTSPEPGPARGRRASRVGRPGPPAARRPPARPARGDPPEVPERLLLPGDQPDQRAQRRQRRLPDPRRPEDHPRTTRRRPPGQGPSLNRGGRPMPIDPDDPRLTAFALGELDDADRPEIEAHPRRRPRGPRLRRGGPGDRPAPRRTTSATSPRPGLEPEHRQAIESPPRDRPPPARSPAPPMGRVGRRRRPARPGRDAGPDGPDRPGPPDDRARGEARVAGSGRRQTRRGRSTTGPHPRSPPGPRRPRRRSRPGTARVRTGRGTSRRDVLEPLAPGETDAPELTSLRNVLARARPAERRPGSRVTTPEARTATCRPAGRGRCPGRTAQPRPGRGLGATAPRPARRAWPPAASAGKPADNELRRSGSSNKAVAAAGPGRSTRPQAQAAPSRPRPKAARQADREAPRSRGRLPGVKAKIATAPGLIRRTSGELEDPARRKRSRTRPRPAARSTADRRQPVPRRRRGNPLSTFSIDVDTASYANVRRFLNQNALPPADAVRIEELVNYFPYDYPAPTGDEPFSVNVEVARCPWDADHRLVRIGLKGREIDQRQAAAEQPRLPDRRLRLDGRTSNKLPLRQGGAAAPGRAARRERPGGDRRLRRRRRGWSCPRPRARPKAEILSALEQPPGRRLDQRRRGHPARLRRGRRATSSRAGPTASILATDGDFNVGVTDGADLDRLIEEKAQERRLPQRPRLRQGNLKDDKLESLADKGNGHYAYIDTIDGGPQGPRRADGRRRS